MKRFLLLLLLCASPAYAQYFDGLPAASSLNSSDIVPICQGGTSGVPGTCTPRRTTFGTMFTNVTLNGGTLSGTFSGSPTLTGAWTWTGGSIAAQTIKAPTNSFMELVPGTTGPSGALYFGNNSGGFGDAMSVQVNSGGNAGDGATGNLVTVANLLNSQFYRGPGATYTVGSGLPRLGDLFASYNGAHTGSSQATLFALGIPTDSIDMSGSSSPQPMGALFLYDNVATGAKGGRIGLLNQMNVGGGTLSGAQPTYNQLQVSVSSGGTNTGSGSAGAFYGQGSQVLLHSGATNITLANGGGEDDLAVESGATVRDEILHSAVLLSTHAVSGARTNLGYFIGSQVGAVGTLVNPFVLGGLDGPWPAASGASLVGTLLQANCAANAASCQMPAELATYGIDWGSVNFSQQSGYGFRSPGFAVDGTGQPTLAGGLNATATSTGFLLDVPNTARVTSVAVATAGTATGDGTNNYYPGDLLYDAATPTVGQYKVTHTKALGATIVAGGSGGTNGTCKVVGTTGTGTKAIFNVTISGGAITAVGSVDTAGDYTVNPTGVGKNQTTNTKNAEPVSNSSGCGSIAGATLNLGMGALTVSTLVGGVFNACPGAGGITPTGGSGAGLTLTPTCGTRDGIVLAGASTKLGFYNATPISKATPSGACAGNTGCQALRDALGNLGLINTGSITN